MNAQLDVLDAPIGVLVDEEQRLDEASKAFDRLSRQPASGPGAPETRDVKFPSWSEYRKDPDAASFDLYESRAIGSSSNAFVQPEQATFWYDRLRNASAFLQANPITVDVADTQLNIPRVCGSGTAAMIAENTAFTATDPTFGFAVDPGDGVHEGSWNAD